MIFNKITIIGVGLIGGSLSLAIKKKAMAQVIRGSGRHEENLKMAKDMGIIDYYSLNLQEACEDSDLVVLATPVGVFMEIIKDINDFLKKDSIVIDVGSVKGRLVYEIEAMMPESVQYIGTHPIAGSDKSGIGHARADLFDGALCVITPTENTTPSQLEKIVSLWKGIGSRVELMDPYRHDEIYGAVSHLPHIIAYSLVNTIGDIDSDYIEYAGQGFKDMTRIAMSSPELWRDIVIFNKENILKFLKIFRKNIQHIEEILETAGGDVTVPGGEVTVDLADEIKKEFLKAQQLRRRINNGRREINKGKGI